MKSAAFLGVDPGSGAEPKTSRGRQLQAGDRRSLLADVSFLRSTGKRVGDVVDVSFRLSIEKFTIVGEVDQGSIFFQPAVYVTHGAYVDVKHGAVEIPYANIVLLKGDGLAGAKGAESSISIRSSAFRERMSDRGPGSGTSAPTSTNPSDATGPHVLRDSLDVPTRPSKLAWRLPSRVVMNFPTLVGPVTLGRARFAASLFFGPELMRRGGNRRHYVPIVSVERQRLVKTAAAAFSPWAWFQA